MNDIVRAAGVGTTVLLAFLLSGCAGGEDGGSDEGATSGGNSPELVVIESFAFMPATLSVDSGTEVRVENRDSAAHTLTAKNGSFDTGNLDADETAEIVLNEPGEHDVFCEIHQYMRGTITVR